ncbi:MAG: DUF58 domain-containing protein [Planctomycetota bacterium]|nr:MAG: DUF58 domain-containing protein [Planctomycetota bacterium]
MLPSRETLERIKRLEIKTGRLVDEVLAGAYHSAFKGRGMEFEDVREYQPGDSIRSIDWNVTARSQGQAFVKTYREERELTVLLLVDVSASERFGTTGQAKLDLAVEFSALIAFSAIRNNDKIGLMTFSDRVESYLPPRKGRRHALRLVRDLLTLRPLGRGTRIDLALSTLAKVHKRKAVVFLISDLEAEGFERDLAATASLHDVICVWPRDPREATLPDVGLVTLEDAETGELRVVDTSRRSVREAFRSRWGEGAGSRERLLRRLEVDAIEVETGKDFVGDLQRFFARRRKRLAR